MNTDVGGQWRYAAMKALIDREYGPSTPERQPVRGYLHFTSTVSSEPWQTASD
jgi:hypothetical protein